MKTMMKTAAVLVGAAAGVRVVRHLLGPGTTIWPKPTFGRPRWGRTLKPPGWHVVTVNRQPAEVTEDGRVPGPLGELGDAVEIQVRPAPGDKGTELAARPRGGQDAGGDGPEGTGGRTRLSQQHEQIRSALRQTKQLLETGEVLRADRPATSRRTPLNRPLEAAIRHAGGGGRL